MLEFFSFLYEQWFLTIPLVIFISLFLSSLSKKGGKKISTHELINLNNKGLSIAQDIIRVHGGGISFTSKPGKTAFSIQIPLNIKNIGEESA